MGAVSDDRFSADAWEAHRIWLRVHAARDRERGHWRNSDWDLARQVADARYDRSTDLYLWSALKGVEQAHWCWARRRLK